MSTYDEQNLREDEFEEDMDLIDNELNENGEGNNDEIKSPLKAIRAFCIDCMGGQVREVKLCPSQICPLHAFRMGKNPYRKRELSPEHLAKLQEARKKAKG